MLTSKRQQAHTESDVLSNSHSLAKMNMNEELTIPHFLYADHPNLVVWSGEFAGPYIGAILIQSSGTHLSN